MAYKSQTEKAMKEIKKELKPFVDFPKKVKKLAKNVDKYQKYKEREKRYKKQQREIKLQKWENRINILAAKIDEHNKNKNFGKPSNVTYKCGNCNTQIKENDKYCPKCGFKLISKENNKEKNDLLPIKERLLEKTKINIKKDIKKYSREDIAKEINHIIKIINDNYNDVMDYINKRKDYFDKIDYKTFIGTSNVLFGRIEEVEKDLERYSLKNQAIESYRMINMIYKRSCELNERMLNKEKEESNEEVIVQDNYEHVDNINNNYTTNYDEEIEDNNDIVYNELEEWQKREVDEGIYDSYNFEEEELEEDDYYYDDDR